MFLVIFVKPPAQRGRVMAGGGDKLRLLDLFSGIGGFSLGLERTGGFETVAFCEIEDFPRKVLAKHWPKVPCYDDIRTLDAGALQRDGIEIDAICGGFPCQDISTAGKGAGIEGERSGLWSEYARLIGELRPQVVFVENVSALLGRGLGKVLGDLAALGYDAEWHCISAAHVGAPHIRDRLWITAFPQHTFADRERPHRSKEYGRTSESRNQQVHEPEQVCEVLADTELQQRSIAMSDRCGAHMDGNVQTEWGQSASKTTGRSRVLANPSSKKCSRLPQRAPQDLTVAGSAGEDVADPKSQRRGEAREHSQRSTEWPAGSSSIPYANGNGSSRQRWSFRSLHPTPFIDGEIYRTFNDCRWSFEPSVGRVANGVPDRPHRLKGLGNAVVPDNVEERGNAYLASLEATA